MLSRKENSMATALEKPEINITRLERRDGFRLETESKHMKYSM